MRDISKDVTHRTSELTLAASRAHSVYTPGNNVLPTKLHQFTKRLDEVTSIRNQLWSLIHVVSERTNPLGCGIAQQPVCSFQ